MKGKQRDLQFRKGNGLKWVSDRIHALELPTLSKRRERFLTTKTGFMDDQGGFKPKPNSNQTLKAIALPIHQTGGMGGSGKAEGPQTTLNQRREHRAAFKSSLGTDEHSLIHQRESRSRAGSGRRYALQPPLREVLDKRHPTGPAGRGAVGKDRRRKETVPARAGILTPTDSLGKGTGGKGLVGPTTGREMGEKP